MPVLDNNQVQWTQNQENSPYLVYDLRVSYWWDAGVLQMPVAYVTNAAQQAGPDPVTVPFKDRQPAVIVQVAQPRGKKVVSFNLVRMGSLPLAPNPTPQDPNEVLEFCNVQNDAPKLMADGNTYRYGMRGVYVYSLFRPRYTNDQLALGSTPDNTTTAANNQTSPSQFGQTMV